MTNTTLIPALVVCVVLGLISHFFAGGNDFVQMFLSCWAVYFSIGVLKPVTQLASEDREWVLQIFDLKRNKIRVLFSAMLQSLSICMVCALIAKVFGLPKLDDGGDASMVICMVILVSEFLSPYNARASKPLTDLKNPK
ncbi:MAG: hypothetical protein K2X77_26355 [Candidatus Obscuribacterales bacterium]|jgi:archaellum biogenesis protein FlaJ (TadC family)|nr:hypothetical protein [Candidatus Obscuribacterales bacterium]